MKWYRIDDPENPPPKDGTEMLGRIGAKGRAFRMLWQGGFENDKGEDCATWVTGKDERDPRGWHFGVCWDSNEDELPSPRPTHWTPLPKPPEMETKP